MAKVIIRNARLSFPDLFEAKQFQGTGPFNYRCTFLIEPENPSKKLIEKAIKEVAVAKWADKAEGILKTVKSGNKICFIDGDTKEYNGYAGNWALSASRDQDAGAPMIVDRDPKIALKASDGRIYGGCYVNGTVEIWAQDNSFGKGIRATLINVQFVKDGASFVSDGIVHDTKITNMLI
jgi:hypothetical protein